jgi:hypothetical protein
VVNEVRAPASATCALRLISDVKGISLAEAEIDPLYPSYRTIPFAKPELTLASLGRRAFRGLGNEAVDYSHRVTAEYAAAAWLAQQVRDGLPLSRVQALIGIDGIPAPELRGIHAWLAVLLPDFSDTIIDADPFGILIYSDPNSLGLTQRARLLQALSRLAAADPYFRPEEHAPIRSLLSALSTDKSAEATAALERLALDPAMVTYVDSIKHALANQRARYREMNYKQPNWAETIATLSGGAPANVADLQALVVEHLREISKRIGTQNIDVYKYFWNEDSHGRPVDPKIEESARNVLLGLLKTRLDPLGVIAEPEGHMVADKRADITAALPGRKLILELKRDIHPELWSALATQLDRFYTRDPEASGYGVFSVFWYGKRCRRGVGWK